MKDWRTLLAADPVEWLLDGGDPSLRYRVLTELLDAPREGDEAASAREGLMAGGSVAKILAKQQPGGHWGREEDFYVRSKYKGTVWNVTLLADLCADPADDRVRRAGAFVLRWSRRPDGGFTYLGGPDGGSKPSLPCLSGNMVSSLTRLGFGNDPGMTAPFRHLCAVASSVSSPDAYKRCWRCRSGAVKVLKGLLDAPAERLPGGGADLVRELAGTVANTCLPGGAAGRGPRPEWLGFGFPLMWNTDLIEVLDLLARAGAWDGRAGEALDLVLEKQDREGRWPSERCFRGRHLVSFDGRGAPSRWTTFRALCLLKHLP